ncbi:hypothetical protein J2Y45_006696 [Dyadobacter sp. BE34]|uniref:Uncharacterized protein n=1 Tax=Dyadobacter fermentans TaxID=94254 RepID=A0ABU1R876_9BACT|nr:hypothetical protein [Dyadobacter fermentans]MDR7047296.1 hypothetical protein [Dyadobacter sp. BE242]MDR7201532.1 hypothetical protein [Dyadobacter sp. BE34]MDR7219402.1 hypothetical protein [Dyadobacter sp. BE31]MDR7267204.1 hypothetical protein [Dyadobacter sp. BE32]
MDDTLRHLQKMIPSSTLVVGKDFEFKKTNAVIDEQLHI